MPQMRSNGNKEGRTVPNQLQGIWLFLQEWLFK